MTIAQAYEYRIQALARYTTGDVAAKIERVRILLENYVDECRQLGVSESVAVEKFFEGMPINEVRKLAEQYYQQH